MSLLTVAEAVDATGAETRGPGMPILNQPLPDVSIDSRTLSPGELFFAIEGEKFDGHDFVSEAFQKGALAAVVTTAKAHRLDPEGPLMVVEDTTAALQNLAHFARMRWAGPLIAITGSMGKTTTRTFTAQLLGRSLCVLESRGNLNNLYGLPLTLLRLERRHQAAVVELGMSEPGEMALLSLISAPTTAVLTNVAPVHLEFFESVDAIAEAKGEILLGLSKAGCFHFNRDDERVVQISERCQTRTRSFGFSDLADTQIRSLHIEDLSNMHIVFAWDGKEVPVQVPFSGHHFGYNLAAAISVSRECGLSDDQILQGIKTLKPLSLRGRVIRSGKVTILDDSYNANPEAVRAVLQVVGSAPGFKRRIAVLGDMLELGACSRRMHQKTGGIVPKHQIDLLVTVGREAFFIGEGAREAGMNEERIRHFATADEAASFLASQISEGDLILVKGSRGIRLDQLVETLKGQAA